MDLMINIFLLFAGILIGNEVSGYLSIKAISKQSKEITSVLDRMDRCIKNQTDYNIQAIRSLLEGDIMTANLALEQSECEAIKFDQLNEKLNLLRNGK